MKLCCQRNHHKHIVCPQIGKLEMLSCLLIFLSSTSVGWHQHSPPEQHANNRIGHWIMGIQIVRPQTCSLGWAYKARNTMEAKTGLFVGNRVKRSWKLPTDLLCLISGKLERPICQTCPVVSLHFIWTKPRYLSSLSGARYERTGARFFQTSADSYRRYMCGLHFSLSHKDSTGPTISLLIESPLAATSILKE